MRSKVYILLGILAIVLLTGCTKKQPIRGFNTQPYSYLQNPQVNIARIYILSPMHRLGATYYLTLQWDTPTKRNQKGADTSKEDVLGVMKRGTNFYVDILPDTPITLGTKRVSSKAQITFTPEASKIYCLRATLNGGTPQLEMIGFNECTGLYTSLRDTLIPTRDYQRQWRNKFTKKNQSPLDGKVFWLSYMLEDDGLNTNNP